MILCAVLVLGARAAQEKACPCAEASWCEPVKVTHSKEVLAFYTGGDVWQDFDWNITTTVAVFGSAPQQMVCTAHKHNTRVVFGADFPKESLGDAAARTAWVKKLVALVQNNFADGINVDIEGNTAHKTDLTDLITELYHAVKSAIPSGQVSFDLAIYPQGQTAGYDFKALSGVLDFIVPMAYDECWGAATATANCPIKSLKAGVDQYAALGVPASKLVLGLPWYAWDWPCDTNTQGNPCHVTVPAGKEWYGWVTQITYAEAQRLLASGSAKLDNATFTKHFEHTVGGTRHAVWMDDPETLRAKYKEAAAVGAKGVAFWTANMPDYKADQGKQAKDMWAALHSFF